MAETMEDVKRFYGDASRAKSSYPVFLDEMRRWADVTVTSATRVPCEAATYVRRMTYQELTAAQRQYYFFWRTEARAGRVRVPNEYCFNIYAQELLELVGVKKPETALARLKILLDIAARKCHITMAQALCIWTYNFAVKHDLKWDVPPKLLRLCLPRPAVINLELEKALKIIPDDMSPHYILQLSSMTGFHFPPEGLLRFGQTDKGEKMMGEIFHALDRSLQESGESILKKYGPKKRSSENYRRGWNEDFFPFESEFVPLEYLDLTGARALTNFVRGVIQHISFRLSESGTFRKSPALEKELWARELIDRYLRERDTRPALPEQPKPAAREVFAQPYSRHMEREKPAPVQKEIRSAGELLEYIRTQRFEKKRSGELFYQQQKRLENLRIMREGQNILPDRTGIGVTYTQLSDEELLGYFSWRTRVREGEYPDTRAYCLRIYAAEILNGVGVPSPENGREMLTALWKQYHARLPGLSSMMAAWVYDYCCEHQLSLAPEEEQILTASGGRLDMITRWVELNRNERPMRMNAAVLRHLVQLPPRFWSRRNSGGDVSMERLLPRLFTLLDAWYISRTGKGLLDQYQFQKRRLPVTPYIGLVLRYTRRTVTREYVDFGGHQAFQRFWFFIAEYSREVLAKIQGEPKPRSRIIQNMISVNPEAAKLIRTYLLREFGGEEPDEAPVRREVTLDSQVIEQARSQADEVLEALTVEETEDAAPDREELRNLCAALYEALDRGGRQLLRRLAEEGYRLRNNPGDAAAAAEIEFQTSRIFARALIYEQGHELVLDELFREAVSDVMKETAEENAAETENGMEYPEEMVETIRIVLEGIDVNSRLERLAETQFSMPDMLIDDANDTAIELFGCGIIDTMSDPPEIVAEMKEKAKEITGGNWFGDNDHKV